MIRLNLMKLQFNKLESSYRPFALTFFNNSDKNASKAADTRNFNEAKNNQKRKKVKVNNMSKLVRDSSLLYYILSNAKVTDFFLCLSFEFL